MNHPPPTDRLEFRCWTAGDLALAVSLWGDTEVTALIGGPFTTEAISKRLSVEIACQAEGHVQYWPVFLRESGEFVGCAGLRPYDVEKRVYELGVHLRPPFWGQGLAVEAGKAVIEYGFGDLNASALFAGHNPKNEMSRKFLLKLGFAYTHDELYPPTGLEHPSYLLARGDR
jgi:[ribosomal protein S5]-alanine N-acetyltransferase